MAISASVWDQMVVDKLKAFRQFLLKDFLSLETLTTKDYVKADMKKSKEEREKCNAERFAGYKKLCLFGLGFVFWGSVSGVLAEIEKKGKAEWINYCFIYSDIALVQMLIGLAASTFPDSSWLAPSLSGLGALQSCIFVLGTVHIGSLKYHSYLDECLYSMIGTTLVITFHWGLNVQDPLLLHIMAKFVVWVIGITVYGVFLSIYQIYLFLNWAISKSWRPMLNFLAESLDWPRCSEPVPVCPMTTTPVFFNDKP